MMANELMSMEIGTLQCQMTKDSEWLREASRRLSEKMGDSEALLAISDDDFNVAIAKAERHLTKPTPLEVAACVDGIAKFFSSFGIAVNQTVIDHWTKAVVGNPLWAIRMGLENLMANWQWATKLPLPSELSKAIEAIPEYGIIRRAKCDVEIARMRRILFEKSEEQCRRIRERERDRLKDYTTKKEGADNDEENISQDS